MSSSRRSPVPAGNILYAQSGGVTAVINATAAGVIEAARGRGVKVYAARNGILGALREELIDTSKESASAIAMLGHTPGGAFGSCRYKLKSLDDNRAEYERLRIAVEFQEKVRLDKGPDFLLEQILNFAFTTLKADNGAILRKLESGFDATLRAYCYAMSPGVFGLIPVCSGYFWEIWRLVLSILAYKNVHRMSGGRATAAVLLPLGFCCVGYIGIIAVSAAFGHS